MRIAVEVDPILALQKGKDCHAGWHVIDVDVNDIPVHDRHLFPNLSGDVRIDRNRISASLVKSPPQGCPYDRKADIYLVSGWFWCGRGMDRPLAEATVDALLHELRERWDMIVQANIAAEERIKERREKVWEEMRAWAQLPVEERIRCVGHWEPGHRWVLTAPDISDAGPEERWPSDLAAVFNAARDGARKEAELRDQRELREYQEETERNKAMNEARAERKRAQLDEAVERLGTETQKAKWREGLMAVREAIDLVVAEETAALCDEFHKIDEDFRPLLPADVHDEGCTVETVDWYRTALEKIGDKHYELLQSIRQVAPEGAGCVPMKVVTACDGCGAAAVCFFVQVSWTAGEIDVTIDLTNGALVKKVQH